MAKGFNRHGEFRSPYAEKFLIQRRRRNCLSLSLILLLLEERIVVLNGVLDERLPPGAAERMVDLAHELNVCLNLAENRDANLGSHSLPSDRVRPAAKLMNAHCFS